MTVTLTQPYSFSFNGLTFGGTDSPYQILSVDGLEALPELRTQDDNRGYADGMFSGRFACPLETAPRSLSGSAHTR